MLEFEANTRDDLYIFGLNEIDRIVQKYENEIDTLPYLSGLEGRQHDRWAPLFIIADIVDAARRDKKNDVIESLKRYLDEDKYLHAIADADESEVVQVIKK
jgi:hypothetical protein